MYEGIKIIKEVPHKGNMTEEYINKLLEFGWSLIAIIPSKTKDKDALDIVYILGSDSEHEWLEFYEILPF